MKSEIVYAFVEENLKTIFAYALSRVSRKEDAEDLAGDIVLAMLRSADRIKNEEALFGYVWKIAENTYKKFLRKKGGITLTEYDDGILNEIDCGEDIIDDIIQTEQVAALRREVSLLSKEYRECTVAYYFDGLSCAEVSEKLGISLEMVKYYLFKSRKILKEGITMEREFGVKSYRPANFEFCTIFSGEFNIEYKNLFSRKLPGNILISAYYTPMTIRELSVELGVSTVYMEDEVALLKNYKLLNELPGGKYQTNLVIFTVDYLYEFYCSMSNLCTAKVGKILRDLKSLLPDLRQIGFYGSTLDDNRLLWSLLYPVMQMGHGVFEDAHDAAAPWAIYKGATYINYGFDHDTSDAEKVSKISEYSCSLAAAYMDFDNKYAAAFADFGVLPKANLFCMRGVLNIEKVPKLTKEQLPAFKAILEPCVHQMADLYDVLINEGAKLMKVHAPKNVAGMVEKVVAQTTFFTTGELIGKCAVDSGELKLPEESGPVAVLLYEK